MKIEDYMEPDDLEVEVCEFIKGDYKTTVICKFNKRGYMVSHAAYTECIGENNAIMDNLRSELLDALEKEDYELMVFIQEKINKIRQIDELRGKPTL